MLTIVGGPMFSGKTTWLIEFTRTLPAGSYLVFKPAIDTRYGKNKCVSHNGASISAANLKTDGSDFPELDGKIKTVLIDELNFFAPDKIIPLIKKISKGGLHIVGVGLLYDYRKMPFGATLRLSKSADSFIKLQARCDGCGKEAQHSYRKVRRSGQFLLGAAESYGACCTTCWETLSEGK